MYIPAYHPHPFTEKKLFITKTMILSLFIRSAKYKLKKNYSKILKALFKSKDCGPKDTKIDNYFIYQARLTPI